jgi:hypothetical protein
MKLIAILLGMIVLALTPYVADAGGTAVVTITAQPWSAGDCPTGFTLNAVSLYEIQIAWSPGNATGTEIRGAYGRWPGNATDGFSVYTGNGSSVTHWVNTEFIGVDIYYRAWGDLGNGTYSLCYASGTVQGGEAVGTMSLGIFAFIPIGLMALSMAWFKVTGKDGWPIMIGAGLAWMALGVYGFATSEAAWDIYYIIGAVSMAMLTLCVFLGYEGSKARGEEIRAKTIVKLEPVRSYGERYADWEKKTGAKPKEKKEKW